MKAMKLVVGCLRDPCVEALSALQEFASGLEPQERPYCCKMKAMKLVVGCLRDPCVESLSALQEFASGLEPREGGWWSFVSARRTGRVPHRFGLVHSRSQNN
ncbi:unnamed protein product [Sphagnum troendelagicum]|uniref:Uncharacterized protein n=1 Tax=Sphagnum troendelagicum TaxID=128251 RepID=A0ABP0UMD1_9BRYO